MSPLRRGSRKLVEESRIDALSKRLNRLERLHEFTDFTLQSHSLRPSLRSQYSLIKTLIHERRDEIGGPVSNNKFNLVLSGVDDLYRNVKRPREQVADAEALLGLTNSLVESLDLCPHGDDTISPSMFVTWLLKVYGLRKARSMQDLVTGKSQRAVNWEKIGADSSLVFMEGKGCKTMLGALKTEFKPRKTTLLFSSYPNELVPCRTRKSPRKVHLAQPKLVSVEITEDKPDVNKNISTISELLKEKKSVMLDKLLFRKTSFAQTVENLFALSFLVNNGQAAISADETGSHFLCKIVPQNNAHCRIVHHHFILRYDYKDWKEMQDLAPQAAELTPPKNGME